MSRLQHAADIVADLRDVDASWSWAGELCAKAAYEIERLRKADAAGQRCADLLATASGELDRLKLENEELRKQVAELKERWRRS